VGIYGQSPYSILFQKVRCPRGEATCDEEGKALTQRIPPRLRRRPGDRATEQGPGAVEVKLSINEPTHVAMIEPRVSLLDAIARIPGCHGPKRAATRVPAVPARCGWTDVACCPV